MSYATQIFPYLCQYFRRNKDRVARVALGAACEQWFSSEAFYTLNFDGANLGEGIWIENECRDRDLVVKQYDLARAEVVLATIEVKVACPNKNLEPFLQRLRDQLDRSAYEDERQDTEYSGIVYALWLDGFTRRDLKEKVDYHKRVVEILEILFPKDDFLHAPGGGLELIFSESAIKWGDSCRSASMSAACITRRAR